MKPGPNIIIECPYCGQKAKQRTLMSGNSLASTLWSDGKLVLPMLPELPVFTYCISCEQFYYMHDAEEIGREYPGKNSSGLWEHVDFIELPTFWEYYKALEIIPDKKYARIKLLHSYNDIIREGRDKIITHEMHLLHFRNLYELLGLLDETVPGELIIKAEAYRNLGLFEKSELIINKITSKDLKTIKEKYLHQIKNKNKELFVLFKN